MAVAARRIGRHVVAASWIATSLVAAMACTPQDPPTVPEPTTDLLAGDAALVNPAISADGAWVAFASKATDLGPAGGSLGHTDVFVLHRPTGQITRVTAGNESSGIDVTDAGTPPSDPPQAHEARPITISADGRYVAFESFAGNLTADPDPAVTRDVFRWDRSTGLTERVSHATASSPCLGAGGAFAQGFFDGQISMSRDGGTIAWWEYCSGDRAGGTSIWRAATGTTATYLLGATGTMRPKVSGDGSVVVAAQFNGFDRDFGTSVVRVDAATGTVLSEVPTPLGTQVAAVDANGSAAVVSTGYGPISRLDLTTGALVAITGSGSSAAGLRLSATAVGPDLASLIVLATQMTGSTRTVWVDRIRLAAPTPARLQGGVLTMPVPSPTEQWTSGTPFDPPNSMTDDGETVVRVQPVASQPSRLVVQ